MDDASTAPVPELACTHRPPCPGCPRFGLGGPDPRARARLEALADELGGPSPEFFAGDSAGYRHRARLVVRGRVGTPKIGLFQAGSHRIVDTPRCPIHHPRINEVAQRVKQAMKRHGVAPYAEVPHKGSVRALQLVVERRSGGVQLVVVENASAPAEAGALLDALAADGEAGLQGLFWNGNPERTNTILGPHWETWAGEAFVRERVGPSSVDVCFAPDGFGQSNLPLFDRIASRVDSWIEPGRSVLELYGGSGALGLGLASKGCRVAINEVSPGGLRGLQQGIDGLGDAQDRVRRCDGPAEAVAPALLSEECFDVAIVDPPRKGLAAQVLDALCNAGPRRLVCVSCGLDAFEREARALAERGGYRLRALEGYDLFPHTEHIESVALFERD